jgi:hypothetical protein
MKPDILFRYFALFYLLFKFLLLPPSSPPSFSAILTSYVFIQVRIRHPLLGVVVPPHLLRARALQASTLPARSSGRPGACACHASTSALKAAKAREGKGLCTDKPPPARFDWELTV